MKILAIVTTCIFLWGCSAEEEDTLGKQIAEDYNAAIDKAENIEQQMMEQKELMDQALKDAEGTP